MSRTTGAGTIHYLQDGQGSVTALTNGSGGLIGRYHYTPWGEGWADAGLPSQPLKWTGRELDETGLYYLRGRYYLPSLGRFMSEDPGGLAASLNLYTFAHNSPVLRWDPFGAADASNLDDEGWDCGYFKAVDTFNNRGLEPIKENFGMGFGLLPGANSGMDAATALAQGSEGNYS